MRFHPDVLAAHAQFGGDLESMQKCYDWYGLRDRVQSLEAELQKAREALEPFSNVAGEMFARNWDGKQVVVALDNLNDSHRVTSGDFFAARRALSQKEGSTDE